MLVWERKRLVGPILCALFSAFIFPAESLSFSPVHTVEKELKRLRAKTMEQWSKQTEEARLLYYLGKYTPDISLKQKYFEEGVGLAWKARKAKPKDPGAILWWVANRGELAQLKHNLVALGYVKEMETALLELKKLHPQYFFRAADRVLGRIYQKAPSFVSIGSSAKAEAHLKEAMKAPGNYPGNLIFFADFLLENGEKKEARKLARRVVSSPELAKYPIEKFDWIRMAQEILQQSRELSH